MCSLLGIGNLWIRMISLRLSSSSNFFSCFRQGGSVFGHGSFVVWGHHFRRTFIAFCCKYMINNECVKGEEVE